jgi:hypothetical protein
MRLRSRLLCFTLASSLLCTSLPARATDDGKICSGIGLLLCGPLLLGIVVAAPFEPKSVQEKVGRAIRDKDPDEAKRVLRKAGELDQYAQLNSTAFDYLRGDDAWEAVRLEVLRFLLEEARLDIVGVTGDRLLQAAVSEVPPETVTRERLHARQLTLARLAVAHGARAEHVWLGDCKDCNTDPDFLAVLLGAGADINMGNLGRPALLTRTIEADDPASVERLIALGADPNGRTGPAFHECETPYELAKSHGNEALADVLLQLGADPGFGDRCRASPTPAATYSAAKQ